MTFEIKWHPEMMDFYKYGSSIEYLREGEITHFKNEMYPPGATIVKWISNPNYQTHRGFLQLPLLERGKNYHILITSETFPKQSVLLKMEFYNRVGERVGNQLIINKEGKITYPFEAYSYSIQLLNNGIKELFFKNIIISSQPKGGD